MTYTIEDVKRLVPEVDAETRSGYIYIIAGRLSGWADSDYWKALLTTRRQLEIARETLKRVSTESHSNFRVYKRMATQAIDAINKEGES